MQTVLERLAAIGLAPVEGGAAAGGAVTHRDCSGGEAHRHRAGGGAPWAAARPGPARLWLEDLHHQYQKETRGQGLHCHRKV